MELSDLYMSKKSDIFNSKILEKRSSYASRI